MTKKKELLLFGGNKGWKAEDWTASDDRSYLDISNSTAHFHGTLDIKTLGGAGFASQRTTRDDRSWDLSDYDGIHLDVGIYDGKRYTLTLKDEILPPNPENGREQSTISYEYDFSSSSAEGLFVPWRALKATYRGKEKDDAKPLDTTNVKRFSLMMRSFFGDQEGDFSLEIKSINAVSQPSSLEKGFGGEKGEVGKPREQIPWNWKESNLVGLAVILSSTWAICFGFCWWRGLDTSFMRFGRWWRMAKS
ncbi:Nn.00g017160.m01.CDS01 [Neocucurbitaria sp. VM-36]